jgi:hypothetical protein
MRNLSRLAETTSPCWRRPCPSPNNLHTVAVLDTVPIMHHLLQTTKVTHLYPPPHSKILAATVMADHLSNMDLLPKYHL